VGSINNNSVRGGWGMEDGGMWLAWGFLSYNADSLSFLFALLGNQYGFSFIAMI